MNDMLDDESGLDSLVMFSELLEPGTPGTKVLAVRFKNGTEREVIIKAAQDLRDCDHCIAAYREGIEVGVLVDEHRLGEFERYAKKKYDSLVSCMSYSPEEFLKEKASKP